MSSPVRPITAAEVDGFWHDGVVCLRGVLDPAVVAGMAGPVQRLVDGLSPGLADLSAMGDALAKGGQEVLADTSGPRRGRFVSGVDHWRDHQEFRDFACSSAAPAIAAALLGGDSVRLWEDSVLVKEPGAAERTAWHQDLAYFNCAGEQLCTMWCPLDVVGAANGAVRYVAGSHRWGSVFQPNLFVSTMVIPGTEGDRVPDIDALAAAGEATILSFDTEPGDVIVHHARTIHGAGANTSDRWRRAISLRYCGDDVRYLIRPGVPAKAHHASVTDGDPLADPDCPQVWP